MEPLTGKPHSPRRERGKPPVSLRTSLEALMRGHLLALEVQNYSEFTVVAGATVAQSAPEGQSRVQELRRAASGPIQLPALCGWERQL